jgi:hypothetical protein
MKVTRLKSGYRIRLTNSEYAALEFLIDAGKRCEIVYGARFESFLKGSERMAYRKIMSEPYPLIVKDNQRGVPADDPIAAALGVP